MHGASLALACGGGVVADASNPLSCGGGVGVSAGPGTIIREKNFHHAPLHARRHDDDDNEEDAQGAAAACMHAKHPFPFLLPSSLGHANP